MTSLSVRKIALVRDSCQLPNTNLPEIAFAGRSNVGKSSLLNALLFRQKPVAPISKKPGRTRSIDFYLLNDKKVIFVDLPGYGYARVAGKVRAGWQPLVEDYLRDRVQLTLVIVLVDCRRGMEQSDWRLVDWLREQSLRWFIVFTKADKLNQGERAKLERAMSAIGYREGVHYLIVSAKTRMGIDELWKVIENSVRNKTN